MKRKHLFPLGAMLIFAMIVAAPAVAKGPCAVVTGGGQAECPMGFLYKIQFSVRVNCDSPGDSKGFVRVTGPDGLWYKVDIMEAAVLDAPYFECPFYPHPADGESRWAVWGPHSGIIVPESIIPLQGRAVWAWGEIVATNTDDGLQGEPVLFGVLSKDQNGGGIPDYIFIPLLPYFPLNIPADYYALVSGNYDFRLFFWLGLDQGHVTFNEKALD